MSFLRHFIPLGLLVAAATGHAADPESFNTRYTLILDMPPVMESDAQKNDVETPIISTFDYVREGRDFLIKPTAALSGKEAWVKVVSDWIEPITAPDGSAPVVRPDQIVLVQLKGESTITLPGKEPELVKEGQDYVAGSTITTGEGATLAVFIGGLNSVRLGPKTQVSIDYQIFGPFRSRPGAPATQRRTMLVKLDQGMVFCKIGYEAEVAQYCEIRAENGAAVASAGDFLVMQNKETFEIGVARGSVRLMDARRKDAAVVNASKSTGLQIARSPEAKGQLAIMTANSRFLTEALDFINRVNSRVGVLLARQDRGETLTDTEKSYLERLPTIAYLQRVRKK